MFHVRSERAGKKFVRDKSVVLMLCTRSASVVGDLSEPRQGTTVVQLVSRAKDVPHQDAMYSCSAFR